MQEFKCKLSMINLENNNSLEINTSLFGDTYKQAIQNTMQVNARIGYKLTKIIRL